jgi:hypothetical protein
MMIKIQIEIERGCKKELQAIDRVFQAASSRVIMIPKVATAAQIFPDIANTAGAIEVRVRNRIAKMAPEIEPNARHCDFK